MGPDAGNYTVLLLILRHCYTVTLNRLHQVVGVSGSVLGWFKSYLADLPVLSVLIISCQKGCLVLSRAAVPDGVITQNLGSLSSSLN